MVEINRERNTVVLQIDLLGLGGKINETHNDRFGNERYC